MESTVTMETAYWTVGIDTQVYLLFRLVVPVVVDVVGTQVTNDSDLAVMVKVVDLIAHLVIEIVRILVIV